MADYSSEISSLVLSINAAYPVYFALKSDLSNIGQNIDRTYFEDMTITNYGSYKRSDINSNSASQLTTSTNILHNLNHDTDASKYVMYNVTQCFPLSNINTGYFCGHGNANEGGQDSFYCTTNLTSYFKTNVADYAAKAMKLLNLNGAISTQEKQLIELQNQESAANTATEKLNLTSPDFLKYKLNINIVYVVIILLFIMLMVMYIRPAHSLKV